MNYKYLAWVPVCHPVMANFPSESVEFWTAGGRQAKLRLGQWRQLRIPCVCPVTVVALSASPETQEHLPCWRHHRGRQSRFEWISIFCIWYDVNGRHERYGPSTWHSALSVPIRTQLSTLYLFLRTWGKDTNLSSDGCQSTKAWEWNGNMSVCTYKIIIQQTSQPVWHKQTPETKAWISVITCAEFYALTCSNR